MLHSQTLIRPTAPAAYASYIDKNSRFRQLDNALIHGNGLARFEKVFDVKVNGLADICECFLIAVAPGVATLERGTGGVPGVPAILEFVRLNRNLENVRLHLTPTRPVLWRRQMPTLIISRE